MRQLITHGPIYWIEKTDWIESIDLILGTHSTKCTWYAFKSKTFQNVCIIMIIRCCKIWIELYDHRATMY